MDFHAEATSEKIAMGWHLDGKVTAVVGTHTHVQTADERILPKGTAYLTDVGMTGPHDSIIGVEIASRRSARFLTGAAAAVRDRHRQPAAERASSSTPTSRPGGRTRHRAHSSLDGRADLERLAARSDERPVRSAVRRTRSRAEPAPAPLAEPPAAEPPAPRRVFTVTELTVRDPRRCSKREFFEVWVEGELSNCRVWNTGHLYFTLKDARAQIKGVMFRSALRYLQVQAGRTACASSRAAASAVYEPKGEYQLVCEHLEPRGPRRAAARLRSAEDSGSQAEGLFDAARKRPLPALPRKIGIVTSLDGAAIRDIIKVLRRRYANAHLVIRPARVQGEGAALEIARALRGDRRACRASTS